MSGYFLNHSIGHYPGKAEETAKALAEFAAVWSSDDDSQWPAALALRDRFIRRWEHLIAAAQGSMTTVENVTVALSSLIGALPPGQLRGKRIVIAEDCFPSLHFLLAGLQERFGFTLDTVPIRAGQAFVEDEDFIAHIGSDVGLVLATFVTSTASKKADLAAIAARAHKVGALLVVDITQGIGIADFAVGDYDVVIGSSLKWLCGYSGAGMLYVRPDILGEMRPELRGWFSQPNPFSWALDKFSYADDARRFDHGTPAILAAVASLPGLDFVLNHGVPALRAHNRSLVEPLVEEAMKLGYRLVSPIDANRRGGSVMLRAESAERAAETVNALREMGIFTDSRGPVMRFSPGISTERSDVDRLLGVLATRR